MSGAQDSRGQDQGASSPRCAELVTWLVDNGFPFDWHSVHPAPAWLRPLVAAEWARRDNEPVENYLWSLDQEQEWAS
jgi:hypothetical protein